MVASGKSICTPYFRVTAGQSIRRAYFRVTESQPLILRVKDWPKYMQAKVYAGHTLGLPQVRAYAGHSLGLPKTHPLLGLPRDIVRNVTFCKCSFSTGSLELPTVINYANTMENVHKNVRLEDLKLIVERPQDNCWFSLEREPSKGLNLIVERPQANLVI